MVAQRRYATTTGIFEASATDIPSTARLGKVSKPDRSRSRVTSRVTKVGIRPRARSRVPRRESSFSRHLRSPPAASRGDRPRSACCGGPLPPNDSTTIEVRTEGTSRGHELGIVRDRSRQPVNVTGFEGGNLAQRVTVELAEVDGVQPGVGNGGKWRRPVSGIAPSVQWTRRLRRPRGLAIDSLAAIGLLPRRRARRTRSHVSRTEGLRGVEAPGDGPRRPFLRRPRGAARCRAVFGTANTASGGPHLQFLVGTIDLGHLACRDARSGRIGPGDIWMVDAGEFSPGRLDGRLRRIGRDAEYDMRVSFHHVTSVSGGHA